MIYPQNIEAKIGFDRIKSIISSHCISQMGVDRVDAIKFSNSFDWILLQITQVDEFKNILLMGESFPSAQYFDVRDLINRLNIIGSTMSKEEVFDLLGSLRTAAKIKLFFNEQKQEKYPKLSELALRIYISDFIIREAERIVDDRGEIKDNASEKLFGIRVELRKLLGSSRNKIYSMLAQAKRNGWAREDAEITIRNGRVVLPMLASHKRSIKGFIHDESATGQTSFVEPLELFENNNRIKELQIEEDQEIKRILFLFADFIRPEREALAEIMDFLGLMDFIRSKAKFAIAEDAHVPALLNLPLLHWKKAVHPLLAISHREKKMKVVSQDIDLDNDKRILIISGPNAGGKSVLLKTIALNQFMIQCGLPITISPSSEVGLFNHIFIDIGDEQSIDNDLSTYSSHLRNIKVFLDNANDKSLILIDEFGSGTEPDLGGAIASASLQSFYHKGSFAVVTTHYAQLKVLANEFPQMVNGAMMFDTNNLAPLFKFKPGTPGSSFAFEIAKSIGLDDFILNKATEIVGADKLNFDFQLQTIENERDLLVTKRQEFEKMDDILAEMISNYNLKLKTIQNREKEIIHQAKVEAKKIVEGANKAIENAISTIRSSHGDKELTKEVRKKIEATKKDIESDLNAISFEPTQAETKPTRSKNSGLKILDGVPQVGDSVIVEGQNAIGVIDSIKKNRAVVDFNSIKMILKLDSLIRVVAPKKNVQKHNAAVAGVMKDIHERAVSFSPNIDVRGKRAEEALLIIESWIDEAVLTSNKNLEILHGKGDGILRMVIREMLQKNSAVQEFRDAPVELGGYGKTILKLV